ncbi:MAG: hypothetical protein J6U37_00310 [Lachnospiraceae bacterium]|nr:hypothetical protein [Lachnospiraceae bacterium]
MELFEKVEKIRNTANVSYEEAKEALEAANGDLLDAMIYLEKNGKVENAGMGRHSTENDATERYEAIPVIENKSKDGDNFWKKVKDGLKVAGDFLADNHLVARKDDKVLFDLPLWAVVIIVLITQFLILILMIVSLFFGWSYKFEGRNNLSGAQNVMDQAKDAAEQIKEKFENSNNN